jgi:cobalt-zinc-cadmium efflux system membrane fusion protein
MNTLFTRTVLCLSLLACGSAQAHGDDEHEHETKHTETSTTTSALFDLPKRQANGEIFLPKPAQRQLNIRTQALIQTDLKKAIELNGQVVLDPQSGGLVQTAMGGQFVPASAGIPQLGQRVQKGQVLGHIQKMQSPLEQASQQAQLAQLKSQLTLSEKRLERIQQLADTLPKKELDAAQAEVISLKEQVKSLSNGLHAQETLRAPSSGLVSAVDALAGKVFAEGALLFELNNPSVLRVEANWLEPSPPPAISGAFVQLGDTSIPLQYRGATNRLKEQSASLVFENRTLKNTQRFPTGQLLKVYVEQAQTVKGVAVPSTAVVKNASNQNMVWIKKAPETFEPKVVVTEALNGAHVLVRQGLNHGDTIVVQGANLMNQIR